MSIDRITTHADDVADARADMEQMRIIGERVGALDERRRCIAALFKIANARRFVLQHDQADALVAAAKLIADGRIFERTGSPPDEAKTQGENDGTAS